jgi:hypothetical protein
MTGFSPNEHRCSVRQETNKNFGNTLGCDGETAENLTALRYNCFNVEKVDS